MNNKIFCFPNWIEGKENTENIVFDKDVISGERFNFKNKNYVAICGFGGHLFTEKEFDRAHKRFHSYL